jgi:hypothetical protein
MRIAKTACWMAFAALGTASPAFAGHALPGLWSSTVTVEVAGSQTSSGQAAQMSGMGLPAPEKPKPVTTKICISPADAAADTPPKRPGCTYQNIRWSGASGTGELVCQGLMNGSGKFNVTYTSNKHYEGSTNFVSAPIQGKITTANTKFSGDWLAADCGPVKP